jgi:hypothetical protein
LCKQQTINDLLFSWQFGFYAELQPQEANEPTLPISPHLANGKKKTGSVEPVLRSIPEDFLDEETHITYESPALRNGI